MVRLFVAITDRDWFEALSRQAPDEVNFWQPSGRHAFRALKPGELLLFKLHAPDNVIVGGGVFSHGSLAPLSLAWEAFETRNGASSLAEMRRRIARYRRQAGPLDPHSDPVIGCRVLHVGTPHWTSLWPRRDLNRPAQPSRLFDPPCHLHGEYPPKMINQLALNLVADVMDWDNEVATREYGWLRLISSMKYDGYSDFRAGVRFLESLVSWLRHFDKADRPAAYAFVKERLVYISTLEMQRVIETFIPEIVTPYLRRSVAAELGIKPYQVWQSAAGADAYLRRLRRCLFVGLSDGSRIDVLRRANAGRLSQEQVIPMMNVDDEKWKSVAGDLKDDLGADARFDDVYLIDDFTASGTTFIRFPNGKPKGKLYKFEKIVQDAKTRLSEQKEDFPLADGYTLHIHHYVSTRQAHDALEERVAEANEKLENKSFSEVIITEGTLLPGDIRVATIDKATRNPTPMRPTDDPIVDLCGRYYDDDLFKRLAKHCREAGQTDMKHGYADCALPLVLEHNTPNNAIPLLWAETEGKLGVAMQPLFFRRDRHG